MDPTAIAATGLGSLNHDLLWPPPVKASLEEDFPRLALSNPDRTIYLDTVGASLYSRSQLSAVFEDLDGSILSNPHSCPETREKVAAARRLVLGHLGVSDDDYVVVFTSGSTAALKLLAESFDWSEGSTFAYRDRWAIFFLVEVFYIEYLYMYIFLG